MTEKTLTTENIKPALDALRGELAPWPVVAKKQDRLNTAQLNAANSGITSSLVAQIIANTAAIRALESAITGTGLRALVVSSLPAIGTQGILYIVPVTTYDPDTDADVVNYSNEYIWIPVEGGTDSEGHYEQVGQTGIVINNGQLTITVNGTSVGTFTANQSGDTTAAITVPTNADYVDRTTDQTVAGKKTWTGEQSFTLPIIGSITGTASKAIADEDGTSIKTGYVNVAGNQTVSGDKSFTGSNTFNNILPNATNTYSLGSSSYQWSSVYAQSYYYNGTAWGLDQNNTWSGQQTITDNTTYYKNTSFSGKLAPSETKQIAPISIANSNMWYSNLLYVWDANGDCYWRWNVGTFHGTSQGQGVWGLDYGVTRDFSSLYFRPQFNNAFDLGDSTHKWKTLNGINPGALSLPSNGSNGVEIDRTNWVYDGVTSNKYTPVVDGWLLIRCADAAGNFIFAASDGKVVSTSGTGLITSVVFGLNVLLPVRANKECDIRINCSGSKTVYLYPCLGNV